MEDENQKKKRTNASRARSEVRGLRWGQWKVCTGTANAVSTPKIHGKLREWVSKIKGVGEQKKKARQGREREGRRRKEERTRRGGREGEKEGEEGVLTGNI